jgi:DNA-binding transcriptional MerR regulator
MDQNELFSGIPALGDDAGLEAYLNNSTLNDMGVSTQDPTPIALQQQQPADPTPAPAAPAQSAPQQQPAPTAAPQFTAEQVAEILARSRQAAQQPAAPQVRQPQAPASGTYSAQQAATIKQLIDRGVPLERIMAAMNGNRQQNAAQAQMAQRLQQIEQHLQQQQYAADQNAFIDKMTTFGNKFGLNEDELVVFGNKAQSMGINLIDVTDVEAVFRAVYPEQYAIRSQRLAGASNSQIFGGASAMESSRTAAAKLEDAYVDQFLKRSMPNQYGMNSR